MLVLPGTLKVAWATGPFRTARAVNAGMATVYDVKAGQSVSIVLGAWWWTGVSTANGTPLPAPPCTEPISDVSRVAIPLASGSVEIDLDLPWHEVCSSPASVSLTVTN